MPRAPDLEITARRENLPRALAAVDAFCVAAQADHDSAFALRLAVEEVCMNLIEHGYAGHAAGAIEIAFERVGEELIVTIRDRGLAFDPAQAPPPDLVSPAETRPIGGLGWHLVKHMIDEVDYRSDPRGGNELRLMRRRRGASLAPLGAISQGDEGGTVSQA